MFDLLGILITLCIIFGIIGWMANRNEINKFDKLFWKKFILSLSIALMFPFVVHYGVQTFVSKPKYDDYVTAEPTGYIVCNIIKCEEEKIKLYKSQMAEYLEATKNQHTIEFFIWITVGLIAIISGMLLKILVVGAGFSWGGLFLIAVGCKEYFQYMSETMMFVYISETMIFVLAVLVLISLVYTAYKMFGQSSWSQRI